MPTGPDPKPTTRDATVLSGGIDLEPPPEVTRFLARAVLLYGIPFHYLVPDERMLPPESIRFFFLDPGWIATLIQGATSVGRQGDRDSVLDIHLRHQSLDRALGDAAQVREKGKACDEPAVKRARWPLTGFLLRSELVDGWPGVEMTATSARGKELAPLRIDRLSADVLLCIFNGKVMELTVKQPPEGMHFGASPVGDGSYQRLSLRKVTATSSGVEPGSQVPADGLETPLELPMRQPADGSRPPTRVVRVAELARRLAGGLDALGHPAPGFTSAELGVQMVESPGLVVFKPPAKQ